MRGANGPMDVITRAEFASLKEKLDDIKVDILDAIDTKASRAQNPLGIENVKISELRDAKIEILATTRRSINEAIAPLASKMDVEAGFAKMEAGFAKMAAGFTKVEASHQAISKSIKDLTHFVMEGLGSHERRLEDQETP